MDGIKSGASKAEEVAAPFSHAVGRKQSAAVAPFLSTAAAASPSSPDLPMTRGRRLPNRGQICSQNGTPQS